MILPHVRVAQQYRKHNMLIARTLLPFVLNPNLSAQFNGEALGLQLLAFWNNNSVWLRKRLRTPPLN